MVRKNIMNRMRSIIHKKKMKLRDYLKNAEEKNDQIAQLYISFKMQYGDKIEKNEQDARRWLTRSANQGNMVAISRKYYLGWDRKEDFSKSYEILIEYLKEQRSVEEEMIGYHMIAYMLRNGKGVEKNVEESVKYYEKSIKRGNYISNFNLGLIYLDGDENILKNIKKAIDLFELSIEQDIDIAQYYLAYIYYKGQKVERDLEKAKVLFKKAVKKNNENAMFYLGLMYYKGEGVQKKLEKATSLFRRSSDLKNFYSMNILGKMYEMGIGVEKSVSKAIELWENSANLGSDFALNKLGNYYLKAKNGVERNVNRALHLYQTAMEVGNVNSMNHLARIYKEGKYVPMNLELAASLYFKSANKDSSKGKQNFKNLVPFIEWKTIYHIYWPMSPLLESQLITLLLISKTRMNLGSLSNENLSLSFLVKGIVMNIIKFLCHLESSSQN